ncbi:MAG TPA: hypothetical protein VMH40_08485 [Myxococcaceae bacterium]|nr:hypothetical protein [Myxococcaceae bacterium]
MTRTAALAAVLLAGGSLPARADEARPASHGFEVGFRTGDQSGDAQETLQGWDFARYGLGVDFVLTPSLRMGPFVHGTVSEYVNNAWSPPGSLQWISQRSVHSWITIGVKLTGLLWAVARRRTPRGFQWNSVPSSPLLIIESVA